MPTAFGTFRAVAYRSTLDGSKHLALVMATSDAWARAGPPRLPVVVRTGQDDGMNYAEARKAFFQPRPDAVDGAAWSSPARDLRDALEPLATVHYWSEASSQAYAAVGLDFLTGYVWSRSCVLGEPEGAVVAAAFGVFEPGAVAGLYDAARKACSLPQVREARERGALAALRSALGAAPAGVAEVAAALRRGVEAADLTARPLFAGLRSFSWPDEPLTAAWHGATALRECRGDSHLAACLAHGLTGLEADVLTELWVGYEALSYTATRAWSPEAMAAALEGLRGRGLVDGDRLSGEGRALREQVEQATDLAMTAVLVAVGDDLGEVVARATGWSEDLIAAGSFPPDPYKRAAG